MMKHENNPKKEKWNISWWNPPPPGTSGHVDFCSDSSLHGLKYISQQRRHISERIFWMIAFSASVSMSIYFIILVWDKFLRSPIIVSFQPTETYIDQVPFPAITICSVNNVLRSIADEYIKKAQEAIDKDSNDYKAFANLYYLDHVCQTNTFTKTFDFQQERSVSKELISKVVEKINTTNLIDVTDFLATVAQNCTDMIRLCYWGDEIQNCSELFFPSETDYGFCCTFNMVPTSLLLSLRNNTQDSEEEYNKWESMNLTPENLILKRDIKESSMHNSSRALPRRQLRAGKSSGLTVLLNPKMDEYFCTNTDSGGFQLEAHFPLSFPKPAQNGIGVRPSSEIFMSIRPDVTQADKHIQNIPLATRQCYFGGEYELQYYQFYTSSNCIDECVANITFLKCECVRYYMPRDNNQTLCGPMKFNCTEDIRRRIIRRGVRLTCSMCLPLCSEISYTVDATTMPLRDDVKLWKQQDGTDASWAEDNVTILHVYFGVDATYSRARNQLYGTVDFISNAGGILGLFLGFSGLSLLEIIYFLTLRAWCRRRVKRKTKEKNFPDATNTWQKVATDSTTSKSHSNDEKSGKPKRRNSNSYATTEEFRTWVVGPPTNTVELSLEISPVYRPHHWNHI